MTDELPALERCTRRMKERFTRSLLVLGFLAVFAACQPVGPDEQVLASPAPDPRAMTCTAWLRVQVGERPTIADQLVNASADLLKRIRVRQHQPPGTPRDTLIRDVVASLTKNCEVLRPRDPSLGD
jgi:hypothetical protein